MTRPTTTRRREIDGAHYAITLEPARSPGFMHFTVARLPGVFDAGAHIGRGTIAPSTQVLGVSRWDWDELRAVGIDVISAVIADVYLEVRAEPAEVPTLGRSA